MGTKDGLEKVEGKVEGEKMEKEVAVAVEKETEEKEKCKVKKKRGERCSSRGYFHGGW